MVSMVELRRYIGERSTVSAKDIALHFKMTEGLVQGMLQHLVDRGDVAELKTVGGACKTGCSCGGHGNQTVYRLIKK